MQNKCETRTQKLKIVFPRIISVAVTALLLCWIFANSLENAEKSSQKSSVVTETVQTIVDVVSPGKVVNENFIRKMAHFTEFMVLGVLTMLCVRVYTKKYMRHIFIPLFTSLASAVTDELIQLKSTGRASEVTDVAIDFSGAAAGIALCILCIIIYDVAMQKVRNA